MIIKWRSKDEVFYFLKGELVKPTMHLRNSTSFLTLFPSSRIESLANCGHPEAIFMSDFGLWNELLSGEGLKVCMMRCHML